MERDKIQGRQELERRALTGTVERSHHHVGSLLDRLQGLKVDEALSDDRTSELLARFQTKHSLKPGNA